MTFSQDYCLSTIIVGVSDTVAAVDDEAALFATGGAMWILLTTFVAMVAVKLEVDAYGNDASLKTCAEFELLLPLLIMSDGDDSAALWKVNRTIHELVKDRGFQVSDDEINMDLATFKSHYANNAGSVDRNQLNFFTNSRYNPEDQIFVFFSDEKSVGVKTMRKLLGILEEKNINRGIIIFPGSMTSSARKVRTPFSNSERR
ncbi:hypothetical protein EWM64_g6102 [Hericium alpestre]|uniref:RNA polymerase Rpb5 N-terminal domain-containing protein n=1 Tax=Hericium alpestre TaxID=135208 RepID=A0A4Y9ZSY2_9AGAM|nr:hypothetical protein EWM64_g6102 [Hericium alpestre]